MALNFYLRGKPTLLGCHTFMFYWFHITALASCPCLMQFCDSSLNVTLFYSSLVFFFVHICSHLVFPSCIWHWLICFCFFCHMLLRHIKVFWFLFLVTFFGVPGICLHLPSSFRHSWHLCDELLWPLLYDLLIICSVWPDKSISSQWCFFPVYLFMLWTKQYNWMNIFKEWWFHMFGRLRVAHSN